MKKYLMLLTLIIATGQNLFARVTLLNPMLFQSRSATARGTVDQTAGFQWGLSGVPPTAQQTDAHFLAFPYTISYGMQEKFEVGAGWGLLQVDRRNASAQFGVSDLIVGGKYRFFEADRAQRTAGLDAEFGFSFPTASFEKGLGTGGLGFLFNWGVVLPLDPARVHVGLGYRLNTENADDVQVGSIFSYAAGVSYPLPPIRKQSITLTGEIKGYNHTHNKRNGTKEGAAPDELYLAPGARWQYRPKLTFDGSLLIGLTGESHDIGITLGINF